MAHLRTLVAAALLAGLPLAAAAEPPKPIKPAPRPTLDPARVTVKAKLDPARTKQLTPRPPTKDESASLVKSLEVSARARFAGKRLEPLERAEILGLPAPDAVPAPRVFDARTNFHDDATYLELVSNSASLAVRPLRNYVVFHPAPDAAAPVYARAYAVLHFEAAPATRYLLECELDGHTGTTFSAIDSRNTYSVTTDDKATLVYLLDHAGTAPAPVAVQLVATNNNNWYLDGCRLTASRR